MTGLCYSRVVAYSKQDANYHCVYRNCSTIYVKWNIAWLHWCGRDYKVSKTVQPLFQSMDSGGHGPHGEVAVLHVVVATDPAPESATHLYRPMEETIALVLLLTLRPVTRQPVFSPAVIKKLLHISHEWKHLHMQRVYILTVCFTPQLLYRI